MIKLRAIHHETAYEVEIESVAAGGNQFECRLISADDEPRVFRVDVVSRIRSRWTLRINGRIEDLIVTPHQGEFWIERNNRNYRVSVSSPKDHFSRPGEEDDSAPTNILSPMAGKVVSVMKAGGETVEARETVAAIEAMKMLNQVKAPRPGTIKRRLIEPGDVVTPGQVLFEME